VKFRRPVTPGDQLIVEAHARRVKSRTGHVFCQAKVGDQLVAEADVKFMMVDADPL
jgi:3-hydroxymyristoyl/3-hydroxydecanoyl-(acyl carrier protein) dehydratase